MFLLIIFCLRVILVHSATVIPLSKYSWNVSSENGDKEIKTNIPTGIYSDLADMDPLFRFNDSEKRWVAETQWTYSVNFEVDNDILKSENIELIFHGLDGTADILLNEEKIGKAINSFVRYRFNVKSLLKPNNNLKIIFESPLNTALEKSNIFKDYKSHQPRNSLNENNVHFLRRMQASFGSQWSPTLPSVGIWKEVELIATENEIRIRDIIAVSHIRSFLIGLDIKVNCEVPFNMNEIIEGKMEARLSIENGKTEISSASVKIKAESYEETVLIEIPSINVLREDVELWWPNGYGNQKLYDLTVTFSYGNNIEISKTIKFGFRKIKLARNYIRSQSITGESFYFEVNDIPIYSKGANFLPVSILPEKSSNEDAIKSLLLAAKIAHMNMLRIPADTLYQSDYFYQLCDEYGILVWQDIEYYKEIYPISQDEHYSTSMTTEIKQQVLRLQYHPSIAIWASSSEVFSNLRQISEEEKAIKRSEFSNYYVKFYDSFYVSRDSRPVLVSTPSNEYIEYLKMKNDNYKIPYTDSPTTGDVHLQHLKGNSWLVENMIVPRFVTEYGLPSVPSYDTLRRVATENDLSSIDSDFMNHRQRRDKGNYNVEILCSISYHFGIPENDDLENFIYASQINQSWTLKLYTEYFRSHKRDATEHVLYKSTLTQGGVLISYLNDVWPATTFSAIEFGGKWKMLQYYIRKFFHPISSYIHLDRQGKMNIYLLSDLESNINIKVKIEIFKYTSLVPIYTDTQDSILNNEKANSVHFSFKVEECGLQEDKILENCLIKVIFINNENNEIHQNYLLPAKSSFKDIKDLANPKIENTVENCDSGKCTISIITDAVALFVWFDTENISGYFSDNGFIMTEERKIIDFYPNNEVTVEELQKSLNVKVMDKNRLDKFMYLPEELKEECKYYYEEADLEFF